MKSAVQLVDTSSLKDVVCRAESAMTQTRERKRNMNEKEIREECAKLAELSGKLLQEKTELENIAHEQSVELFDLKKIIAGAQNKEEVLLDYIDNMCGMIEAETPLKEHDRWLDDCVACGFYEKAE
tara:strand:- start:3882 stop:4259 length:378 start_codon:yes stop_codon:yes gene_type:complete